MRMLLTVVLLVSSSIAQIRTVSIEKIQLPATESWSNPIFSQSGTEIFFTNGDYNGIWRYSFETKLLNEITRDRHSGYNFSVSPDGNQIAFRRTNTTGDFRTRIQESIVLDLKTGTQQSLQKGNSVSLPIFHKGEAITAERIPIKSQLQKVSNDVAVLGIENTKIILLVDGEKKIFDPLNGNYVWPVLSPDRQRIAAVDMDRGAFVCTVDGRLPMPLGRLDAPQWERSGSWIIGMEDIDDGHRIISSDIVAKSNDGKTSVNLTEEFNGIAMYPACSPAENKIAFSTADGEIFILTYEEAK
ncbi:MAG: hypothetical protein AB1728_00025 [Bacteroidota bacterium]